MNPQNGGERFPPLPKEASQGQPVSEDGDRALLGTGAELADGEGEGDGEARKADNGGGDLEDDGEDQHADDVEDELPADCKEPEQSLQVKEERADSL